MVDYWQRASQRLGAYSCWCPSGYFRRPVRFRYQAVFCWPRILCIAPKGDALLLFIRRAALAPCSSLPLYEGSDVFRPYLARSLATAVHPSSCTAPCSSLPLYEGSDVFRPYLARSLTGASSDTPFVASLELQRFSISCGDVCRGGRRSYVRVRLRPCRYRLRAASRRER